MLRVYGKKEELEKIEKHAKSISLSASTFMRKTALAEISRHPTKESQEELMSRIINEVLLEQGLIKSTEDSQ